MPNTIDTFIELTTTDLHHITGGAGAKPDFASIREQAAKYCPNTAEKYGKIDPSTINRGKAQKMGNECIAEMGSFMGSFAKPRIDNAINEAFPQK
jgi:hypothetical protein